ncbi:07b06209-cfd8-402b-a3dc-9f09734075db [Sclerotinia trifoliorum]|uniref:07b06209-cfd8-402b-a3dc-9f09734075db n=1 Tax=Sclerotinia trifoliorum TaxID=28548 RepID=A0A8H2ZN65_9HELO|nr:07b06209-cfd8-402b-a3dc-9f09734075db [Sclerotinia trifoliorum]
MTTPAASDDSLFEPKGLTASDGKYVLDHAGISSLLRYVWSGVLLPTTKDEYLTRTGVASSHYDHVKKYIDPLLLAYAPCKTHCTNFKNTTYPSIVALSHSVKDFAGSAGGKEDGSYYAAIIAAGKTLSIELKKPVAQQDSSTIDDARETIKELIDAQLIAIDELKQIALTAVNNLHTFEEQCQADRISLNGQDKIITDALTGDSGDIVEIQAAITANKAELSKDQSEYDEDVTIASTAVTYAWCWPIGTIVAATIMGVYGARAVEMQGKINGLKGLLADEDDQIKADKALVADLTLMKADLETLISMIGPAIRAIEGMSSVWENIALDLQSVRDYTQEKSGVGLPAVQKVNQNSIINQWNNLYTKVDNYLDMAYVTEPEQMTLDSYVNNLSAVINAN